MYNKTTNTATKLGFITKRSKTNTQEKFTALAHLLNTEYLMECYKELKKRKAPGIDGKYVESYTEKEIKQEIEETITKIRSKKY